MSQVELDTATHIYTIDQGSRIVPGVSQILTMTGRATKAFYKGTKPRENGTEVHGMTQTYDTDINGFSIMDWLHIDYAFYLKCWQEILDETSAKWEGIEELAFHEPLFYAGMIDRRGLLYGRKAIADIKTGSSVPGWAKLQTSGYAIAAYPNDYRDVDRYVFHINPKLKRGWKLHQYADLRDYAEWIQICEEFHDEPNQ